LKIALTSLLNRPVFITDTCIQQQRDIITAVESVIALPAYQKRVLAYAPPPAKFIPQGAQRIFRL